MQINAVVIATSKRGAELLAAADLYAFGKTDDLAFKPKAETVVEQVIAAPFLATVPAKDILFASVDMIGTGEHPHRTGMMGRNTIQRALIKMATVSGTGILGATAGQIFIHSGIGNAVITDGASLADKAIGFFLHNEMALRMLGASAPEGFGFLSEFIDWLKQRLNL